jgi:ligand-binding sensor domain-containing protein/signal transduction histidine kinase/AraC-like DNA-binding protein
MMLFRMAYRFLLLFSLLLLFSSFQEEIRFTNINIKTGLSHNSALCLIQDHDGFIWIGTRDGLNKFDGVEFTIYRHSLDDSLTISNNQINCIYETSNNELWIGTANGLNKFDPSSQSFTRFFTDEDLTGISDNYIWSIHEDIEKNIWIGTTGGIKIFSDKNKSFSHLNINSSISDNSNTIITVFRDSRNIMWIGTRNGLYQKTDNRFTRYYLDKKTEHSSTRFEIRDICESLDGIIWVGTEGFGLYGFNSDTVAYHLTTTDSRLNSNTIRKIFNSDEQILWLGTLEGLNIFNKYTSELLNFTYSDENSEGISNNSVRDIIKDRQGGIWIATYAGGVNYYHPKKILFSLNSHFTGQQTINKISVVTAFLEESNGNLWIGTDGGGLHYYNQVDGKYLHYLFTGDNCIAGNNIKSLGKDSCGNLWIGTFNGLSRLNIKTQQFTNYYYERGQANTLNHNQVHALYIENDRRIWIGTNGGGLQILDQVTGSFFDVPGMERKKINTLFADKVNQLWIGSQDGIRCIDKNTLKEIDISGLLGEFKKSIIYVNFITSDSSGNIWIGTQGYGLFLKQDGLFYWFNEGNGLNDNTINALLEDEKGQLWITTNKGLSRVTLLKNGSGERYLQSKTFSTSDGLQGYQFYPHSALKSKTGRLFFGGVNGYNQFFPWQINDTVFYPTVILTELSLKFITSKPDNVNSPIQKPLSEITHLVLNYNQRDFTISFVGLNYISPENTLYRYMVHGLDKGWIDLGTQRFINFTYFPVGNYEFRIKATTNPEKWDDTFKSLQITILPPWWKTVWAFAIYSLLLGLLLFAFFWYSHRWAKLKNDLAMEHFQREKEEELHQLKLKFFTDVAHELRTPLTLILAPLEKITMQSGFTNRVRNQFFTIQRNGLRLMQLVNQILDLRKLETGHETIRVAEGNISRFLRETSLGFKEMASSNGIAFEYVCDFDKLQIWYERDKMEIILYNLLSNAFKNTPKGGKVRLLLSVADIETIGFKPKKELLSQTYVQITVADNGKGIPNENIDAIFNRFYTLQEEAGNLSNSSGVGLELTRRLVELHHGMITVESRVAINDIEGETKFTVWLPMGKTHFKSNEIVTDFKTSEDPSLYTWELQGREHIYDEFEGDPIVERSDSSDEKPQLLIVEDNSEVRNFIKSLFICNYFIEEAENGEKGLEKAFNSIPDLIISDIMMPVMDGIEFCRRIKTDLRTSHIPVILLTARTAITFKYEGLETGADEYITKPFSAKYLLIRVKNLIKQRDLLKTHFHLEAISDPSTLTFTSFDEKLIRKAFDYIIENISDPSVNVNKLSKYLGLSRVHFYRKIKAMTNMTAVEFIRSIKLKRAALLLGQNKLTVKEVRNMTGFEDADYFRKSFKNQFGVNPSDYVSKIS